MLRGSAADRGTRLCRDWAYRRSGRCRMASASPSAGQASRPSMIAEICSPSIVSYCSSACAILCSLSMFVVSISRALPYAVSITLRTTSSILRAVSSDTCLCCVTERPRKTSSSSSLYVIGPSSGDRPYFVAMSRASAVARWMSFDAPVVTLSSPNMISSATRPPYRLARRLSRNVFEWL